MNKKRIMFLLIVLIILVVVALVIVRKVEDKKREYVIEKISEYKYFIVKENEKYGVIDNSGKIIIEPRYEDVKIPNPSKAVFVCYDYKNTFVLNENGSVIFEKYENVQPLRLKNVSSDLMYEKTVLQYSKDNKYGLIDIFGNKLTDAIYENIQTLEFKEGELLVKLDNKYGIINIKGNTLVKAKYDKIEVDKLYDDENGYKNSGYIVSNITDEGYRYGYVTVKGKEIVKPKYNDLHRITEIIGNDIYIICAENGKYGVLKNGNTVIENEYQSLIYNDDNKVISALKGKNYGVISLEGKIIVPFEYKQIDIVGEYIYGTSNDEKIKIYDVNGQEQNLEQNTSIIDVKNTDYKIHIKTANGKTTYSIFKDKTKISKSEYSYIQYLFNNYFIACNMDGKIGIIDDKENIKVEFNNDSIQKIGDTSMIQAINSNTKITQIYSREMKKITELENATIETNEKYIKLYNTNDILYISLDEKVVENTEIFTNNKIFAKKFKNKWGFVDITGNKIVDYKYDEVTEVNKYGFAGVKLNGKWGIINDLGTIIVEPKYELAEKSPTFIGEYFQVIYGNGEKYYTK